MRKTRAKNEVDCGARGLIRVSMLFWSFLWPPPQNEQGERKASKGRRKGREKAGCATKAKEKTTDFSGKKNNCSC